jgi:hypothetical protein
MNLPSQFQAIRGGLGEQPASERGSSGFSDSSFHQCLGCLSLRPVIQPSWRWRDWLPRLPTLSLDFILT